MLGQTFPVQVYAVTDSLRCAGHAVFDDQWLTHEAVEAEAVDFQVGCVRNRRQQMNLQIVHAVGRHR
jgi:hypothetical protein